MCVGLIAANFLYQAFRTMPDWKKAVERSWFQVVAMAAVIVTLNHIPEKAEFAVLVGNEFLTSLDKTTDRKPTSIEYKGEFYNYRVEHTPTPLVTYNRKLAEKLAAGIPNAKVVKITESN